MCHRVKTKRFNQTSKQKKTTEKSDKIEKIKKSEALKKKNYDLELILFNNNKVMVNKIELKEFLNKDIYQDNSKNIYEKMINIDKLVKLKMKYLFIYLTL